MEDREYVICAGRINLHIDAANHPEVLARYVNDNSNKNALNAEFVKIKDEGRVLLRAVAEVSKGAEIYASYGEVFWRNRKGDIKSSSSSGGPPFQ